VDAGPARGHCGNNWLNGFNIDSVADFNGEVDYKFRS
jgi:hypothetical protein